MAGIDEPRGTTRIHHTTQQHVCGTDSEGPNRQAQQRVQHRARCQTGRPPQLVIIQRRPGRSSSNGQSILDANTVRTTTQPSEPQN